MAFLNKLKREAVEIEKNIMELALYSEGGLPWSECWVMSSQQREIAAKAITKILARRNGQTPPEEL